MTDMAQRPDTLDTALLMVELLRRIPRGRKKETGFHLLETPLSKDQQAKDTGDGWLEITATVVDSAMLDWWLRGFGESVREVRREEIKG